MNKVKSKKGLTGANRSKCIGLMYCDILPGSANYFLLVKVPGLVIHCDGKSYSQKLEEHGTPL